MSLPDFRRRTLDAHARTRELEEARQRLTRGGDAHGEATWEIQGPGTSSPREDWRDEFSLLHFKHLLDVETRRRRVRGPRVLMRYPFLAAAHPEELPGIEELERLSLDSAIVATADPMHHGLGYGDFPDSARPADDRARDDARARIEEGFDLAGRGLFADFQRHCLETRSDARDVGPVLGHLLGGFRARVLDLVLDDMSAAYGAASPTWVAGALLELAVR